MTMEKEQREDAVEQAQALCELYTRKQIGLDIFGMWSVKLAYDLMVGDELQLAVGVVSEVPDKYYEDLLPSQIVEDDEFRRISEYLAHRFKVHGFVEPDVSVNILSRIGIG